MSTYVTAERRVLSFVAPTMQRIEDTERPRLTARKILIPMAAVVIAGIAAYLMLGVGTFWLPAESMEPNFMQNSRIVAWTAGGADRGDVVIYDKPEGISGATAALFHRVIGLGGETISFTDGQVFIDGELLNEPYLPPETVTPPADEVLIPDGHVFVMGDNRPSSADSRIFGPIPESLITHNHAWIWRNGGKG